MSLLSLCRVDPKMPFFQILVPTIDTVRYSYLLKLLLSVDRSVNFNGVTGVGKSVIMNDTIIKMTNAGQVAPIIVNFGTDVVSAHAGND